MAHVIAAGLIAAPLAVAFLAPDRYDRLMEEDRAVEWGTVVLFLVAGAVRVRHAVRARRLFDALVALFCLFVAGEEVSWGQRLIGYTPSDLFLEHNTQQEANVHNFADIFGRPKWMLIVALAGYGLLLPALARVASARRLLERVGASAPESAMAPWFFAAAGLLIWYPVTFTGEWVELLSAWLFVATAPLSAAGAVVAAAAAVPVALGMTWISAARAPVDGTQVRCAQMEVQALVDDLIRGDAVTPDLEQMGFIHKRLWSSVGSGYVDASLLRGFREAPCSDGAPHSPPARRRYGVDPWGTAYWLHATPATDSGGRRIVVYSFGPNRRRDGEPGETTGDDISAEGVRR